MQAFKFETTIQQGGVIHIPEMSQWAQRGVEVFVVISPTGVQGEQPALSLAAFLDKLQA